MLVDPCAFCVMIASSVTAVSCLICLKWAGWWLQHSSLPLLLHPTLNIPTQSGEIVLSQPTLEIAYYD